MYQWAPTQPGHQEADGAGLGEEPRPALGTRPLSEPGQRKKIPRHEVAAL